MSQNIKQASPKLNGPTYRYSIVPPHEIELTLAEIAPPERVRSPGFDPGRRLTIPCEDLFSGARPAIKLSRLAQLAPVDIAPELLDDEKAVVPVNPSVVALRFSLVTLREEIQPPQDSVPEPEEEFAPPPAAPAEVPVVEPVSQVEEPAGAPTRIEQSPGAEAGEPNEPPRSPQSQERPEGEAEKNAQVPESAVSTEPPSLSLKSFFPFKLRRRVQSNQEDSAGAATPPMTAPVETAAPSPKPPHETPSDPLPEEAPPLTIPKQRRSPVILPALRRKIPRDPQPTPQPAPQPQIPVFQTPEPQHSDIEPAETEDTGSALPAIQLGKSAPGMDPTAQDVPVAEEREMESLASSPSSPVPPPIPPPQPLGSRTEEELPPSTQEEGPIVPDEVTESVPFQDESPAEEAPEPIAASEQPVTMEHLSDTDHLLAPLCQEKIQEIFLTEQSLTLERVLELCGGLPGIRSCILARGSNVLGGIHVPGDLDLVSLTANATQMLEGVRSSSMRMGLGSIPAITIHSEKGPVSFFHSGELVLLVLHADRGFIPGVRERLRDVVKTLANSPLPLPVWDSSQ